MLKKKFIILNNMLILDNITTHLESETVIWISCDGSNIGLSVLFFASIFKWIERPIWYDSKKLKVYKLNIIKLKKDL